MKLILPMKVLQTIITTASATLIFLLLNEASVFNGSYAAPFEERWVQDFFSVYVIFLPFIGLITAVMYTVKKWLAQKYKEQEEQMIYYYFVLIVVVNTVIVLVVQFVFLEKIVSFSWLLPILTLVTYESFEMLATRDKTKSV